MFNDKYGLTRAVLDGRKTMTRRIIDYSKNKVFLDLLGDENYMKHEGTLSYDYKDDVLRIDDDFDCYILRPYYKIGEEVAIAQSYSQCGNFPNYELDEDGYPVMPKRSGYFNKMFVKAELMPYRIRITNVKIERMQDISAEDCLREGIRVYTKDEKVFKYDLSDGFEMFSWQKMKRSPSKAFASLIDKVSGKGVWKSNPWVFTYEFELIK